MRAPPYERTNKKAPCNQRGRISHVTSRAKAREQKKEDTNLGHWWLWYNTTPADKLGRNVSRLLVPVVQAEVSGDRLVTFRLHSPGYRTYYRSREYSDDTQRPNLRVLFFAP